MTTISANVILHSISDDGIDIVTIHARYPRFIHSEVMTHRAFSRNARSSRAVPVATMLQEIQNDPVIPLHWGANQRGMQADEACNNPVNLFQAQYNVGNYLASREDAWLSARDRAVEVARGFADAGYHKQVANRILEPFMHIDTLITATDWRNFLALRDDPGAEPHIADLARAVRTAINNSTPQRLRPGQWHLPYVDYRYDQNGGYSEDTRNILEYCNRPEGLGPNEFEEVARKVSTARCARISYTPFNGNGSVPSEIQRHDDLVAARPVHASPTEHQATPDCRAHETLERTWVRPNGHRNFRGWIQYRSMIANETVW